MTGSLIGNFMIATAITIVTGSLIRWASKLELKTQETALSFFKKSVEQFSENKSFVLAPKVKEEVLLTLSNQPLNSRTEEVISDSSDFEKPVIEMLKKSNSLKSDKVMAEVSILKEEVKEVAAKSKKILKEMRVEYEIVIDQAVHRVSVLEEVTYLKIDELQEKVEEKKGKSDQFVSWMSIKAQLNSVRKIFCESVSNVLSHFAVPEEFRERYSGPMKKYVSLL